MKIRLLEDHEEVPLDLLLLADPSQEMIAEYLQRGQCYVGLDEREQIVAVIVLLPTRPGTLEIVNIAVREAFQGRGIGKKLIQFALDQAREKNAKTIEIGTGNSSVGQLLLYQKCGFRITGIDRDFFIRHYPEKIYENGIQCRDMIRLSLDLFE
ncbi:GNAT family N-acetyltransferase [Paenibacillus sp. 3LSP]|uniref:GNAT family N-acetyltransferase n=1 Tax=Paenibacillus sp. 3LSP TaxID=2800795 RepID=UPI0028FD8195|nr:GNAT family N-acetyltransferase [Paenibacillus sp. 3LSP]MDU0330801.1 GNAT family N-acetyltransferase [Paenibacillus sp. 3LSP]